MNFIKLLTSFEGRIGRMTFWLASLALLILVAFAAGLDAVIGHLSGEKYNFAIFTTVASIAMIAASFPLAAKRWHDRNKSAWWILIGFIPVIGEIWTLAETGLMRGTKGPNQYGNDPLA